MSVTYGFFNSVNGDRKYNADQMSEYFDGLVSDGVYESVGGALQVLAGDGMTVKVQTGRAIIGSKWIKNDAVLNLTINTAHVTLNRYTAVILRLDRTNRTLEITTKDGENATNPIKPSLTDSAAVVEKCLAYVYVSKGVTTITQSNIEDVRANTNECGWVTGIVKQVDTSTLFLQWQNAYEQYFAEMENWKAQQQETFETWLNTLTSELKVNTYIERYHKVIDIGTSNGVFPLDMDGYTYSEDDIILINVNGVTLTEVYDYLLDTSKSPVEIHTNANLDAENILEITVLKSVIGMK